MGSRRVLSIHPCVLTAIDQKLSFGCAPPCIAGSSNFCATNQLTPLLLLNLIHPCCPPSRAAAGKFSCRRHTASDISFSLFCCQSNIASKYQSYQTEYQHVPQQQQRQRLLLRIHIGKSHQFTWLRIGGCASPPSAVNALLKRKKTSFSPPFRVHRSLGQRKLFRTNLWYSATTTMLCVCFSADFSFPSQINTKGAQGRGAEAKVVTAAKSCRVACFDRAVSRILHLIPPQKALYSQRILIYLSNIICQSSRYSDW